MSDARRCGWCGLFYESMFGAHQCHTTWPGYQHAPPPYVPFVAPEASTLRASLAAAETQCRVLDAERVRAEDEARRMGEACRVLRGERDEARAAAKDWCDTGARIGDEVRTALADVAIQRARAETFLEQMAAIAQERDRARAHSFAAAEILRGALEYGFNGSTYYSATKACDAGEAAKAWLARWALEAT